MKITSLWKSSFFAHVLVATVVVLSLTAGTAVATTQPIVGMKAPDFTLETLDGESVTLARIVGKAPVVLLVLRGFPGYQCPLCTQQVHQFVEQAAEFRRRGIQVVMIYPGPADHLQAHADEFLADKSWPEDFIFLLDPEYRMVETYGLRWAAENETAYPSAFVIDLGGNVVFAKISKSHAGRTAPDEALGALPRGPQQ